jgi:hypothetical protein
MKQINFKAMVTYEQYMKAREIIREWGQQEEENEWDGDDYDLDLWLEDEKEREEEELVERAATCRCGAWIKTDGGRVIHVSDCCCGAE